MFTATALISSFSKIIKPTWLTGPIFDKELRVSSRRKRNYVLRFVYLALLTIFLVLIWLEEVKYRGSAAYRISRMARAGQSITIFIVWFQFCATQIIAIIMLSTAISDEIRNRTLGTLMTTPINSLQIVMGKLFSKLLQLILLLAVSLPLLAVVRVFGGIPWNYLIASLCITITAIIFVGSLSLFFSIFSRRAYVVIIRTVLSLGMLFAFLPLLATMLCHTLNPNLYHIISEKTLFAVRVYPNPYGVLSVTTQMMLNPRGVGGMPMVVWPLHCSIMLVGSAIILALSMSQVRKVALRQAAGQLRISSGKRRFHKNRTPYNDQQTTIAKTTKRVKGSPVVWKELRSPLLGVGGHKIANLITIPIALIVLLGSYWLVAMEDWLHEEGIHMAYISIFMGLGILFTIVLAATGITSEKESRSWPILLTTTLSDWQIVLGKLIGTLRRSLPIWALLFGHVIVFSFCGFIHPIAVFQMAILVAWIIVFLSCTGLYFSSRFKHTTTAVVMNFTLAAIIWGLVPLLMAIISSMLATPMNLVEGYLNSIPFVQAAVVMEATADGWYKLDTYSWPEIGSLGALGSTLWMLAFMAVYILLGFLFAWRAKRRIRRNIF